MSTQQDIYVAGSENCPHMLNKENYVPWSSRLPRYAKSRPNGKLIYNSIMNGPYVRRIIPEPGDAYREILVNETFHEQRDDELTEKELKLADMDKIEERSDANCILMANLQQASTSGTQTDSAPVYDSDGSTENESMTKIERLQAQLGDQKGKSTDTPCVSDTLDPLSQKLENENVELEFQVSEQKGISKGTSVNTQFRKQSILGKPPSSYGSKLYLVTPFPKSKGLPKIDETHALSKPVTSN
ncbi:hypothetical protein Tco_0442356 [Tanacetum coccineum]